MKKLLLILFTLISFYSIAQQQFDYQAHSTTGSDTYTVSITNVTAYKSGTPARGIGFSIIFDTSSSGACSLNVNGLGAIPINGDITAGVVYRLEYNVVTDEFDIISGDPSGGVSLGTEGQIPFMNSTDDDFDYSSKFTWDNTNNRLIAGNGTISSGTNNINFGDNTTLSGSWSLTSAEESTIRGNNNISAGWDVEVGDGSAFSGSGTITTGIDNINYGVGSYVGGVGGYVINAGNTHRGGFVHAFSDTSLDGKKPSDVEYLIADGGAFNVSRNTSNQTAGHGSLAQDGAILGGINHNIPSSSPRSVIIGGDSIKARASDPDNVYVPYLNVTEMDQDDTLTQVIVRNRDTDKVYWRNANTLGSAITPAALSVTDDTNYDLTLTGSPTTALLQATGITISHSGVFGVSRGGTGTGTQFTPGSLIFAGSSGVYSQDNSNLFWDDANNRIGKGVTTPLSQLHFVGQSGANTAPIQFSTGTLESTARAGTQEYSTSAYFTNAAGVRFAPGGLIHQTFADVNNSGTTATDMYTRTLIAGTLGNNGESIVYSFGGTLNDATATYQFITSIGGQTIFDTGAITVTTATGSYSCDCRIVRTSSSVVRGKCVFSISTSDTSWQTIPYNVNVTGLTLNATNILKYTVTAGGASGGTNDATHKEGSIYWYPLADD